MADAKGLKRLALLFCAVFVAATLIAGYVVKGHAEGRFTLENERVLTHS